MGRGAEGKLTTPAERAGDWSDREWELIERHGLHRGRRHRERALEEARREGVDPEEARLIRGLVGALSPIAELRARIVFTRSSSGAVEAPTPTPEEIQARAAAARRAWPHADRVCCPRADDHRPPPRVYPTPRLEEFEEEDEL